MESSNILNIAFQDIEFNFKKISEEELTVADSYKKKLDEAIANETLEHYLSKYCL